LRRRRCGTTFPPPDSKIDGDAADAANRPDYLITGATAGIGLETAVGLARAGFRVILAGRDEARLDAALRIVAQRAAGVRADTVLADFASLAAVQQLAEAVLARYDRLDVLVNNAGLIARQQRLSEAGYEMTLAVNHLVPFLLTNLLLDRLRASAPARIVTVASQAHKGMRIDPAMLAETADWTSLKAYGRSKLCNILFTRALARRLDGGTVMAACLRPGVVATKIGDSGGTITGLGWRLIKPFLISPEKGAATSLFLATTPDPTPYHGAYLIDCRVTQPDPARWTTLWASVYGPKALASSGWADPRSGNR
jgi:NAD(P)-dependent dehydrogenase (short-subunit alcohol dehydrogenase family)